MLLRYGARNFFCFRDWMIIDLTFNSKFSKDTNIDGVARSMCLKGANSSGKTNSLKALAFLGHFCKNSFNNKPDQSLFIDSYFGNSDPVEFFIDFKIDKIEFSYEAIVTNNSVISEKIFKKEKRKVLVISRNKDKLEKNSLFDNKREIILRNNASIISTAHQYEISEFQPIYGFFDSIITNVGYSGLLQDFMNYMKLSEAYNNDKDMLKFVTKNIVKFDTGIEDIRIGSFKNDKNEISYFPVFKHLTEISSSDLLFISQSSGTKSLYLYLVFYYLTLQRGGLLVLDEFDINLHPDILPHLVELFDNVESNPKHAQIIFSTHNTDVLDIMGKYRTYLFNKENGNSYCYRLDELDNTLIRNDRSLSPLYKSGKIGGVPKI